MLQLVLQTILTMLQLQILHRTPCFVILQVSAVVFNHLMIHTSLHRFAVPWLQHIYRTVLCSHCCNVAPESLQSCSSFQTLQSEFTVP